MPRQLFVNLPVRDLPRSVAFFTGLGFRFNAQFTDETATCMIVNETSFVMLVTEPRFKGFTNKELSDATTYTECLMGFSADSRAQVDELVDTALRTGGTPGNDPADHGFMYTRSFQDPDGHIWEVLWMDPSFVQEPPKA